jgi:DNA-binding response OmpR family regulator
MRILLVEDSVSLCEALKAVLEREKFEVQCVHDGDMGLEYGLSGIFDLIILDVMMPKKNGFEVLDELRKNKITTPIIMLTALSQELNKVQGLDMGADDYLAKPFSTPELLARIRAILRRRGGDVSSDNTITYGNASLNISCYVLSNGDKSVKLSNKECEILRYMFERPKQVAEKDALINKVWGFDNEFESNSLEVFISFVRKKIAYIDANFTIQSIRGVGYQLQPKNESV